MICISILIAIFILGLAIIGFSFNDVLDFIGMSLAFIGAAALFFSAFAVIIIHANDRHLISQANRMRTILDQSYKMEPCIRSTVYGRVMDMNNTIISVQEDAGSPYTNWFHESDILDLKLIQ